MIFKSTSLYPPPNKKKIIANLEITQDNLGPLTQRVNNINTKIYTNSQLELGSLHFFPEMITVGPEYGLCDGMTTYETKNHTEYFKTIGYYYTSYSSEPLYPPIKNNFPNITGPNSPTGYRVLGSEPYYSAVWHAFNNGGANYFIPATRDEIGLQLNTPLQTKLHNIYIGCANGFSSNSSVRVDGYTIQGIGINLFEGQIGTTTAARTKRTFNVENGYKKDWCTAYKIICNISNDLSGATNSSIGEIFFYTAKYRDNDINQAMFVCPNLLDVAPSGFKPYIFIGPRSLEYSPY